MDVRIGVIGTGIMGADHVRTLADDTSGACVTAVSDLDAARARSVVDALGLGDVRVLESSADLVSDAEVDAVLVATADETHEELVLRCLATGKPVLCEKPLTPLPEGSLRIVAAEVALGRRLVSVGFMRRYDPGYAVVKASLRDGEVGGPLMLHCVHRNASSPPGTPSDDLVTGSAVHEIDAARWLLDDEITGVTVHRPRPSSRVVGGTSDPIFVIFQTDAGVLVDVEVFINAAYGYDVRCELVGETGTVSLDEPVHAVRRGGKVRSTPVSVDWRDRFAEAYRRELQDWVAGVRVGEQRGATAWDGYAATAVATAGVEALETGTPVKIALEKRPPLYDRDPSP
jgi:myo-inositol 2-dehydrogenase / D-chiro-inositol 1-dehydrogenase